MIYCQIQWNNHGYDTAKWFAKKFTHISPVWLQVRYSISPLHDKGSLIVYIDQINQDFHLQEHMTLIKVS